MIDLAPFLQWFTVTVLIISALCGGLIAFGYWLQGWSVGRWVRGAWRAARARREVRR